MFFKDIDSWGKNKLRLITLLCGLFYVLCATVIPTIIIANKYDLTTNPEAKITLAGLIVITIIATAGLKAVQYVIGILPQVKRGQQIIKFGLGLIIAELLPALVLWVTYIVEKNMATALFCIRGACYSFMGAIIVDYTCLKTLQVQWSFEAEFDKAEKLDRIRKNRK